MDVFEEGINFVRQNYDQLTKEYDGKFIAVLKDKVVADDKKIKNLIEKLHRKGINPKETFIEYISRKKVAMIV